jgi:hypothetical protein
MAAAADKRQQGLGQLAELSGLADGTLDPTRASEVQGPDRRLGSAD